jgi:type II secretion system protein H
MVTLRLRCRFTLLEMMIVLVIVTLVLALAVPRVGRLPSGLLVRSAASHVRSAFRQAATCSRATGTTITLTLEPEKNLFRQAAAPAVPVPVAGAGLLPSAASGTPPVPVARKTAAGSEEPPAPSVYAQPREYVLPKGITWHVEAAQAEGDAEAPAAFTFFASGEAAGHAVEYSVGKRRFRVDVDRLTGRPIITDAE